MGKPRLANYLKYLIVLYKYLHVFCLWDFWGLLIHSGDSNSPIRKYIISYIIYKKIIHKVSITITITIIIIIIIIIKVCKFASQSIVVKALSNVKLWHRTLNKPPRNIFNFCIRYLNNTLPILALQSISGDVADNVSHPLRLDPTMKLITYSFVLYLQYGCRDVKCKPLIRSFGTRAKVLYVKHAITRKPFNM